MARFVLGAELFAFADGFEFAFCIKKDLENMLRRKLPVEMLTGSKRLFVVITRSTTYREKRLMIDLSVVKEAYR